MEEEKLRELEAAQAETVRKLAAAQRATDRAAELQFLSPALIVLDCIRSASPGSTEIFGRRLAGHLLSLDFRFTPTLPTCLQAVKGQFSQLEKLNYPKKGIKTIKDALNFFQGSLKSLRCGG